MSKKFIVISIGILIVLLGVLAVGNVDYSISEALINESSLWARVFDVVGEVPAMLAMIIGVTLLYGGRNREKKWWNIVSFILAGIVIALFSFLLYFNIIRYMYHEEVETITTVAYIIMVVLSITTIVVSLYLAHTKGENVVGFKRHAWVLIILVLSEMILVNIVKSIWARPRMRSIVDGENEFQHWYQISGWSNDNELKSFPSGHTANAFVSIAYMMFVPYFKHINKNLVLSFAILWGVLVALSRVVLGAHFLSDVLIGGYITIFLFLLWEKVFYINKQIEENK